MATQEQEGFDAKVITDLKFRAQEHVILFVPSHDKSDPQKNLPDQADWAKRALDLFGNLYGGATAFKALEGVWRTPKGKLLYDQPIMVQSLAERGDVEDRSKLKKLETFCKKMGRDTNQACVAIAFNNVIHYIEKFGKT